MDTNGKRRTEKSKRHVAVLFDYFFPPESAKDKFLGLNHIYPQEFASPLEASDHTLISLDLSDERSESIFLPTFPILLSMLTYENVIHF